MRYLERYLERWAEPPPVLPEPNSELRLAIVIPCKDEPEILPLIEQLHRQAMKSQAVEIVVVVNHAEGSDARIVEFNRQTVATLRRFASDHPSLPLHVIEAFNLPPRRAGVGLARKIGMDAALRRFAQIQRPAGIIASLDADCLVSEDYTGSLLDWFAAYPESHAATLNFAHRLNEITDPRHRQAMVGYEIFLRYIVLGWRYAKLPYAFAAIGSCFAVRADAYARHCGMNRRQAGEDFYFLHKLAREKTLGHIKKAWVYPSARISSRTPFGTGQAVAEFCRSGQQRWLLPHPSLFEDLRILSDSLDRLFEQDLSLFLTGLPDQLADFLRQAGLESVHAGMRAHAASSASFRKRFFTWFDGLKAWRYVNRQQATTPIEQALPGIARKCGIEAAADSDTAWLQLLRRQAMP